MACPFLIISKIGLEPYTFSCLLLAPLSSGAYALHSLPLNDEARSGRRDLNPQPQPWQGYALPCCYFRQRGNIKQRSTTEQFTYHLIRTTSVFPPDHRPPIELRARVGRRRLSLLCCHFLRWLLLFYDNPSCSSTSLLGTGRFLSHSFSPLGWRLLATRASKRTYSE